ncbi:HipA domain-containing protein [Mucilaginibacter paludis]|uniref:HipA domain-containing protein n=1 Tax=Mucilaginibacter paludis TaxID=423351 RepID=UPI001E45FF90|nr:HipA domain-containing protein [Mucilaginibacter paludis]
MLKELAEQTINTRIAVTGVQPKLSVTLQKSGGQARLTLVGLWGEYILKPQQEQYPLMPETEDLTMHLASLFKIEVCEHTLLRATDGSLVYLAKRFDRVKGKKIHVEDFCQLSELLTENKYKGSYERAGKLILKYCVNKGLDALSYFELVLFSYLTGNNDMHLKNFSLMHQETGIRLSPAYDLLNVNLLNPADDEELALTLNGRKRKISRKDFEILGNSLQIPEKAWRNSMRKFASMNNEVNSMIDASFLGMEEKERYKNIWLDKQAMLQL